MATRRAVLRVVGGIGLLGLGGCSGDDETEPTTDTEPPSDRTTDGDSTPMETTTETTQQVTLDPIGAEQTAKLVDPDGDMFDMFGSAVAVSRDGTTVVVGARQDDDNTGSASVFERSSGSWSQTAKLQPDDSGAESVFGSVAFGSDVALADGGDRAFVSAAPDRGGSVYVFEHSADGWGQVAKIAPPDDMSGLSFGRSIAPSQDGSRLLVGASRRNDVESTGVGALFEPSGETWERTATLDAAGDAPASYFGSSVALTDDGETAVVGAPLRDEAGDDAVGRASVFEHSGRSWSRSRTLAATEGTNEGTFGYAVAVGGDASAVLVGAPYGETAHGDRAGVVYAYTGEDFGQEARLVTTDGGSTDHFGYALDLTAAGRRALIGAVGHSDPNGGNAGATYAFGRTENGWGETAKLVAEDGDRGDYFGECVATNADGDSAVIGAEIDEDPHGDDCGSAYHFSLDAV